MSSQYNGIPANITLPGTVAVSAASDLTPIQVTTGTPHGLQTGDMVQIREVQGNTAANGVYEVSVVDGSNVLLVGSVGNGAYTTGGTIQQLGFGSTFQIPSDGDTFDAAAFNVAYEALADRTALLAQAQGTFKFLTTVVQTNNDGGTAQTATWGGSTNLPQSTWTKYATLYTLSGGFIQHGDLLDIEFTGSGLWTTSAGTTADRVVMTLATAFYDPGASPGAAVMVTGAAQAFPLVAAASGFGGIHLRGRVLVPALPSYAGEVAIYLYGNCTDPGGGTVFMTGDAQTIVTVRRATPFVGRVG